MKYRHEYVDVASEQASRAISFKIFLDSKDVTMRNPHRIHFLVQGSAKMWAPGCVNAAGKARQKW